MKGYVEIEATRIIDAVNNYEENFIKGNERLKQIKSKLKGIIHKGWFSSYSEWDNCHESSFGFPDFVYIKENHPELYPLYYVDFYGNKKDTSRIKALALEGVMNNVLCDEELSYFVGQWA